MNFERKVLLKMFRPETENRQCRIRVNFELEKLHKEALGGWGHRQRMEEARNSKKIYQANFIVVLKPRNLHLFLRLYTNEIALKST